MRRLVLLAAICALSASGVAVAQTSFGVRASASFQRLGDWRIDRAPTLQGAVDAFGAPSTCRTLGHPTHARAAWRSLGLTVDLLTYGLLPAGKNGCTAPKAIRVNWVQVTGRQWVTARGLGKGDSVAKLRRLYPTARRNPRGSWPRPNSYWLVTRRTACLGDCGNVRFVTVPQLLAEIRRGRVAAFFFHVGAQGE